MNRTIHYNISKESNGFRIEQFLKHKGYSSQNLTQIKRMPKSVLVNGQHCYMRDTLKTGDTLTICIQENDCSEKIRPFLFHLILYMKMRILLLLTSPPECRSTLP